MKIVSDDLNKLEIWWLRKNGYLELVNGYISGNIEWTRGLSQVKSSISVEARTAPKDDKKPYIRLYYTTYGSLIDDSQTIDYQVRLESTACNFGGHRWWFRCPLVIDGKPCRRRVGVLYQLGDYFGCRHCYNLSYRSRNKNRRYSGQPLFDFIAHIITIDELGKGMKRRFYAGKPTKKLKRFYAILDRLTEMEPLIKELTK